DPIIALQHLGKAGPELLGCQVSQETKFAQVDPQDRNLAIAHLPGGSQNRAVPPEDDGQIRRRQDCKILLLQQVHHHDAALLPQKRQQPFGFLGHARPTGVAQDKEFQMCLAVTGNGCCLHQSPGGSRATFLLSTWPIAPWPPLEPPPDFPLRPLPEVVYQSPQLWLPPNLAGRRPAARHWNYSGVYRRRRAWHPPQSWPESERRYSQLACLRAQRCWAD